MREIDTTRRPWKLTSRINVVHLSSQELLDFVEKNTGEETISATIKRGKNKSLKFENFDEIKENLPLLTIPLVLELQKLTVIFSRDEGVVFTYKDEDRIPAEKALNELKQFRPWFAFLKNPYAYSISIVVLFYSLFAPDSWATSLSQLLGIGPDKFKGGFSVVESVAGLIVLFRAYFWFFSARIKHTIKPNFFQRNRDQIVLVLIGALAGGIVTAFFAGFLSPS